MRLGKLWNGTCAIDHQGVPYVLFFSKGSLLRLGDYTPPEGEQLNLVKDVIVTW